MGQEGEGYEEDGERSEHMAKRLCKYTVTGVYVGHPTAELLLPLVHSGHEKSIGHSGKYPGLFFE